MQWAPTACSGLRLRLCGDAPYGVLTQDQVSQLHPGEVSPLQGHGEGGHGQDHSVILGQKKVELGVGHKLKKRGVWGSLRAENYRQAQRRRRQQRLVTITGKDSFGKGKSKERNMKEAQSCGA